MRDATAEDVAAVVRNTGRLIGCLILILAASSCAIGVAIGLTLK